MFSEEKVYQFRIVQPVLSLHLALLTPAGSGYFIRNIVNSNPIGISRAREPYGHTRTTSLSGIGNAVELMQQRRAKAVFSLPQDQQTVLRLTMSRTLDKVVSRRRWLTWSSRSKTFQPLVWLPT